MESITAGSWMGHFGRGLAPRELEALLCIAQGMTTKEIARVMGIAPGTAANRIENVMFKLGVARRTAALAEAMRRQIISPVCLMLAAIIAFHAIADDPVRRDRRIPDQRPPQVRLVRRAEAMELHA
ncbi:response regulator transcription factor [Pseudomonas asplenii]|uniref:response regulator transcription factor n=1 Tax=Pseudomonas asplenii TaxID=53407 RepID=UPI0006B5D4A1|nr:helix-turn-helix transcriptional regulator [Pseudomonas fuscovaginae]